jgi:hypothetical protein
MEVGNTISKSLEGISVTYWKLIIATVSKLSDRGQTFLAAWMMLQDTAN